MRNKELRIGNLVYGVSDRIEEVIYILPNEVNTAPPKLKQADFLHKIDEIQPIPLTEEWLKKFGFIKDGFDNFSYERVYIDKITNYLVIFYNDDWIEIPVKIKYVHQLQNLYFSLTGEELILR